MALNERSWDGLELMAYGRVPGQPMDFEQTIAGNLPGLEVQLESYESYEDALDYCKQQRSVGFLFMLEDDRTPPIGEVFRNLAAPFAANGWQTLGVVVHKNGESFHGHRTVRANPQLIDYLPWSAFEDSETCQKTMLNLWQKFVSSFEEQFIPHALQESLIATASKTDSHGSLIFYDQLFNLLTANLSLSWKERFALRWYQTVELANRQEPAVLEPHKVLLKIVESLGGAAPLSEINVERVKDQTVPLGTRMLEILKVLSCAREQGELPKLLDGLDQYAKPGSPAILRSLGKQKQAILKFSKNLRAVG